MRFRTKIEQVQTFYRIIQTVEKLTKKCVIRLSPDVMQIICAGESEGGVQVWSKIKVESLFSEWRIQSNSNNDINLEVSPDTLGSALRSCHSSPEVVMKLAKKDNQSVLTFDIQHVTPQGKAMHILHDVRIVVMKPSEVEKLKEPLCPEPDVHIILPPLSKLRTISDHLRQLSGLVGVSANRAGDLTLTIQTDDVKVETMWTDCERPDMPHEGEDEPPDPKEYHRAIVSVRSFSQFLSSHAVSTTTIACICAHHCLIMYVYIGEIDDAGGVLTFYIPARRLGDD